MTGIRSLTAALLILTGLGLTPGLVLPHQAGPDTPVSDEEYDIYSSVIKELYVQKDTKQIIIEDRTFRYDFSGGDDRPWRDKPPKGLTIDESAVADYEAKNHGQSLLHKSSFKLPVKWDSISDADLRTIFHGHWGDLEWTEYYRRFPDSGGFIMVSRVGFNTDHTQALLYMGSRSGPYYGEIHFLLLQKANGAWSIKRQLRKNKFG